MLNEYIQQLFNLEHFSTNILKVRTISTPGTSTLQSSKPPPNKALLSNVIIYIIYLLFYLYFKMTVSIYNKGKV